MRAYFLSDIHLGAPYFPDSQEGERRVVRFLDSIKHDASHIFLVGDILDYWYEYKYVVPKGYVRFFGKLAELSDMGVRITWLIGNHDIWIFDYLPRELGITVVDGPWECSLYGERVMLAHGDGLGKTPWVFRTLRRLFRNRVCQWAFAGIHPRWTVAFAQRWSRTSRADGLERDAANDEWPRRALARLTDYTEQYAAAHPDVNAFVYGHLHQLVDTTLPSGARMFVLGDWLSQFSFLTLDADGTWSLQKWQEA